MSLLAELTSIRAELEKLPPDTPLIYCRFPVHSATAESMPPNFDFVNRTVHSVAASSRRFDI